MGDNQSKRIGLELGDPGFLLITQQDFLILYLTKRSQI